MRKPVIAGNWKMHGNCQSVVDLLSQLVSGCKLHAQLDWIVFPPYVFLHQSQTLLENSNIILGAQDLSARSDGAYTGDISASMLKDIGCQYVLVGHSERRAYHYESNQLVAAKFLAAIRSHLYPVLCVGETEEQRDNGQTFKVIEEQLAPALTMLDNLNAFEQTIIAYEPVWAIGTGKNATPEMAEEIHSFIRQLLKNQSNQLAETVRIVYGGSVKPNNAAGLFNMPNIDGALVGGASLEAKTFIEIGEKWNK